MGMRLCGGHAGSVPRQGHQGTTRRDSHLVSPVDPGSHFATAPDEVSHRSRVSKLTQEIEMSTIHQFRPAVSVFVTALTFAFSTPFAVNAEDEVIVSLEEAQVLVAVPAGSSWDETSGYGSVEASRAAASALLAAGTASSWDDSERLRLGGSKPR